MSRNGRYLLFYAILGIGLAISWGQVGKRTQLVPGANVRVLSTESDCRPRSYPCAAYASDFALVLGPERNGLRLMGENVPQGAELKVQYLDLSGKLLEPPLVRQIEAQAWLLNLPQGDLRVRVNLLRDQQQWTADFVLSD